VAEAIGRCAESGRRVLESELSQCAVTLRRVLPEYLQECPCTGEQVLQSLLQRCRVCQQLVSPAALVGEQCQACRTMLPVPQDDPRLRQILERYPRLGRLRNLRRAETSSVQVVSGNTTWRRLLVVFSKPDGEVLHLAFAGRLSGGWTTVPEAQRPDWLQ
jgi:hypothetical protein